MKRFVLLLLLLIPAAASAQVSEHVIDLPETSHRWFLTAVYSSTETPTAKDRALMQILREDWRLQRLISQVVFTEWDDNSQFVRQSDWKHYLGSNRPAILLQTPAAPDGTGGVVYFASGPHLKTDANLARSIKVAVESYKAYGNARDCPRCPTPVRPTPEPPVQPPVTPIPPTVPDIPDTIQPPADTKEETPLIFVLLPLLGAGFGLYQSLKKESQVV